MTDTMSLSLAESLRVIGQDLGRFQPDSVTLEKTGAVYLARIKRPEVPPKPSQRGALSWLLEKIQGSAAVTEEVPETVRFTHSEIIQADAHRRVQRFELGGMPMRNLSLDLRALGDYLDRKRADDFIIRWSKYGTTVSYGSNEEYFTVENLHDLGIHLYLKRATRERAK